MIDTSAFGLNALDSAEGDSLLGSQPTNLQQALKAKFIGQVANPNSAFGNTSTSPQLTDEHLHPPDENGIRKFTDSGKSYLGGFIPDNTNLISSLANSGGASTATSMPGLQPQAHQSAQQVGSEVSGAGKLIGSTGAQAVGSGLEKNGLGELLAFL